MHQVSADNVLLRDINGEMVPQLTGFASAPVIIERDKFEKENVKALLIYMKCINKNI